LTGSLGHCWGATDFRGDGAQLLALVRDIKPELVVTDIRMPPTHTTEGLDAAQVIRDEFPDIAILVLSAHVEVEHAMELLASGRGIGYLLKNRVTDVADFLDTLRSALIRAAQRKSLRRVDAVHHGEPRVRQKRLAPPQRGRQSRRGGDKRCAGPV
jgi:YesN/AraC family two-component response regulator